MRKWLLLLLLLGDISAYAKDNSRPWHGRIFQTNLQKEISLDELTGRLRRFQIIVLGEKHNTPAVQTAQQSLVAGVVLATHQQGNFITAWEFLNYPDQEQINAAWTPYANGAITAYDFLMKTQGSLLNDSYIPILEVTRSFQGKLVGVNISREAKAPVVDSGITALDPQYLPPDFSMGTPAYHRRFVSAMSGHTPPERIENYYAAQCLTDDIMAFTLEKSPQWPLVFLIVGGFHADYSDGVVSRIIHRLPGHPLAVIRFLDASDYDATELNATWPHILHDKVDGDLADYVWFVNEPHIQRITARIPTSLIKGPGSLPLN